MSRVQFPVGARPETWILFCLRLNGWSSTHPLTISAIQCIRYCRALNIQCASNFRYVCGHRRPWNLDDSIRSESSQNSSHFATKSIKIGAQIRKWHKYMQAMIVCMVGFGERKTGLQGTYLELLHDMIGWGDFRCVYTYVMSMKLTSTVNIWGSGEDPCWSNHFIHENQGGLINPLTIDSIQLLLLCAGMDSEGGGAD